MTDRRFLSEELTQLSDILVWIDDNTRFMDIVAQYCSSKLKMSCSVLLFEKKHLDAIMDLARLSAQRASPKTPIGLFLVTPKLPEREMLDTFFQTVHPRGVISDLELGGAALGGLSILTAASKISPRPFLALVTARPEDYSVRLAKDLGIEYIYSKKRIKETASHILSVIFPHIEGTPPHKTETETQLEGMKRKNRRLTRERNKLIKEISSLRKKAAIVGEAADVKEKGKTVEKLKNALDQAERDRRMLLALQHDLVSSSTSISDTLDSIWTEKQFIPPILADRINNIRIVAKYCSILVNTAADLGTSSRPKGEGPGDVARCLREAVEIVATSPGSMKINLDIASDLPPCTVPNDLLIRCAINLLRNSYEALKEEGTVEVSASVNKARRNKVVTVIVKDNGIGIRKYDLPKIFNYEFTTKGKKSGFGLYIVKRIMDEYGGKVSVSSVRRKGTTVTIQIPAL